MNSFLNVSSLLTPFTTLILTIFVMSLEEIFRINNFIIIFTVFMAFAPLVGFLTNKDKEIILSKIEKAVLYICFFIIYLSNIGIAYFYYKLPVSSINLPMPYNILISWLLIFFCSLFVAVAMFDVGSRSPKLK